MHNLTRGGAHRRLQSQLAYLERVEVHEVCLETAIPVTDRPHVVSYRPLAPRLARGARPPLRHWDLAALVRAWRRATRIVERGHPDAVYVNPCRYLQAPAALLTLRSPSLYFCDEPRRVDYEPEVFETTNPRTRGLYAPLHGAERLLDRRAVARATTLVTNSAYTAVAIRKAYGRDAVVLPLGVPEGFTPRNGGGTYLLSVGSLLPDKGHHLVLSVAARLDPRPPVVVIAPEPAPLAAELSALAERLGVDLTLRIGVSDRELIGAYREALATLYLARDEPLGLVSLEAQACGCPVIVAQGGGLPETLIPDRTGWTVPREDTASASRCVERLRQPAIRARMAVAAAQHGAAFPWTRSARELRRALEAVIG
jgi:glycosyltransferase involved in cell wall biosynthesis